MINYAAYEGSFVKLLLSSFVVNGFEVLHVKGFSVQLIMKFAAKYRSPPKRNIMLLDSLFTFSF